MDKDTFLDMDIDSQIEYLNSKLSKGLTVIRIREDLGIGEKSLQKIIKEAGYVYNQKLRQYIPTTQATTKPLEVSVVETNTNTLLTTEKANTLDYISNNINILMDMIEKYKTTTQSTTESTTNYIKIDLIDDKHLKPKPKSIRINEFVYQEWQEFCDKQHYSKMDLISMALKEYMEKYK